MNREFNFNLMHKRYFVFLYKGMNLIKKCLYRIRESKRKGMIRYDIELGMILDVFCDEIERTVESTDKLLKSRYWETLKGDVLL